MSGVIGGAGTRSGVIGFTQDPTKPIVHAIGDASTNPALTTSYAVVTAYNALKDQGNNFATGVFTAPTTGIYLIAIRTSCYDTDANDLMIARIETSNRNYDCRASEQNDQYSGGEINHTIFADLDAGDTAKFTIKNSSDNDGIYNVGIASLNYSIALL